MQCTHHQPRLFPPSMLSYSLVRTKLQGWQYVSQSGGFRASLFCLLTASSCRPIAEFIEGTPDVYTLAATPPLVTSLVYFCKNQPCRRPPLNMFKVHNLSACQGTLYTQYPGHPRTRETVIPVDWRELAQSRFAKPTVDLSWLPDGGKGCGTVAQCLIKFKLNEYKPADYWAPQGWHRKLPGKLGMWHTFVIGLEEDQERFEALRPHLRIKGFGVVTRALGINPNSTDMTVFQKIIAAGHESHARSHMSWKDKRRRVDRRLLSKGEVGCALSHYLVWLEVVARKLPFAIVFEDDVRLTPASGDFQKEFERNIRQANRVIMRGRNPRRPDVMFIGHTPAHPSDFAHQLEKNIWHTPLVWCSFAYIVSLEGAQKLVHKFLLDDPVDNLWWRVEGLEFWAMQPGMAGHLTAKDSKNRARFKSRVQDSDRHWMSEGGGD